ncbi:MAG TPA: hypothetical protein VGV61_18940 [Thermoanaerobaculia bacterium]|jgi:hypothetical protein|nr:hypothetical protein [Thermoanaerobaculia bacterium]
MGSLITQWTLVRPRRVTAEVEEAEGYLHLRSPSGEVRSFAVDRLSPATRAELRGLASGSKVPAALLSALLRAEAPGAAVWTLDCAVRADDLYVSILPPGAAQPSPMALSGLRPAFKRRLHGLAAGDRVPEEIVAELIALAPRCVVDAITRTRRV